MAPNSAPAKFVGLPLIVIGQVDIGRLLRELAVIEQDLLQQQLKQQEVKLPKTSKMMDAVLDMNGIDLVTKGEVARLQTILAAIKEKAPVLHFSFSADPAPAFVEQLIAWVRKNLHPLALIMIGLQPNIGAGCIVRTTNKYFDFSLAPRFAQSRELLVAGLRKAS